jgi:hypothetical protein
MKRITPSEVLDAYAKTGLKPVRREWVRYRGKSVECACPLTAVLLLKCVRTAGFTEDVIGQELELTLDYVRGFVAGVDGRGYFAQVLDHSDVDVGIRDGLAAAAAVFQGSK